jgi:hypothetical protein
MTEIDNFWAVIALFDEAEGNTNGNENFKCELHLRSAAKSSAAR